MHYSDVKTSHICSRATTIARHGAAKGSFQEILKETASSWAVPGFATGSCWRGTKEATLTTSFDLRFRLNLVLVTLVRTQMSCKDPELNVRKCTGHTQKAGSPQIFELCHPRYRSSSTWCAPDRHTLPSSCRFRSLQRIRN